MAKGAFDDGETVTCEYQLNETETVPLLRWIARRRPGFVLLKLSGVVAVGFGISKLAVGGTPVIEGSTIIYGGIMLGWVMTEILIFRSSRASFRLKTWARPHQIVVDAEGLDIVGPSPYPSRRSWSDVRSVKERLGFYILAFGLDRALIIPRSAFTRPSDEAHFRRFAHMERTAKT